jgi:hypothetical protein
MFLIVGPVLMAIFELLAKEKAGNSSEIAILSTAFVPLLNSMSTLVFIG